MATALPAGSGPLARVRAGGGLCLLLLGLLGLGACAHAPPPLDAVSGLGGVRGEIRLVHGEKARMPQPSVVYLSRPGTSGEDRRHQPVTVRRQAGRFEPEFVALPRGQSLRFANEDGVHHRLFALEAAAGIEVPLPPGGTSQPTRLERAGTLRFYCRLHAEEEFTVLVVPSRHFDVVDGHGAWAIPRVPRGSWRLHLWSEVVNGPVRQVDVGLFRTRHETIWLDGRRLAR
jgi:plastocyanin